ncbi:putative phosphatase regulatory subunit-domain-containing protein [Dichotomocladium elegans]|nr:putative phosphatase regulatory subunit-domain-containing protein [Dichotomocladium elegans]
MRRVSLVRTPSHHPIKSAASPIKIQDAPSPPSPAEGKDAQTNKKKKKSVRFSDSVEQVWLFHQWDAPHRGYARTAEEDGDAHYILISLVPEGSDRRNNSDRPIQLERVVMRPDQAIAGQCRVANLAYEKHVMVRYTLDRWATFYDVDATFRASCVSSDLFDFKIALSRGGSSARQAEELQLSLRYCVNGFEFWDNNHGQNYCYRILHPALSR